MRESNKELATEVEPYLNHLLDWDCKGGLTSTQTTLCIAWYEELYGFGYPAETLKKQYVSNVPEQFKALIAAAQKLKGTFGDWKIAYGDVNRLQRYGNVSDLYAIPFSDSARACRAPACPDRQAWSSRCTSRRRSTCRRSSR